MDYNLFTPGVELPPQTLTIAEQLPGASLAGATAASAAYVPPDRHLGNRSILPLLCIHFFAQASSS